MNDSGHQQQFHSTLGVLVLQVAGSGNLSMPSADI